MELRALLAGLALTATALGQASHPPTKGFPRRRVDVSRFADSAYVQQHARLLISEEPLIYSVRGDGSEKTLIRDDGITPSWTPDGRILFSSFRSGSLQIWVMDADGGNSRQIGNVTAGAPVMPQMARNGTIAFMLFDDHSQDNAGI